MPGRRPGDPGPRSRRRRALLRRLRRHQGEASLPRSGPSWNALGSLSRPRCPQGGGPAVQRRLLPRRRVSRLSRRPRYAHQANFRPRVRSLALHSPWGATFRGWLLLRFFLEPASRSWRVRGCDIAAEPCRARASRARRLLRRVPRRPAPQGRVDAFCLWDTIEHLTDPDAYLRMAEVLAGGILAVTTGDIGSALALARAALARSTRRRPLALLGGRHRPTPGAVRLRCRVDPADRRCAELRADRVQPHQPGQRPPSRSTGSAWQAGWGGSSSG